ncbi:MAG: hypothetical protein Q8R12_04775 [bacterium]|nr:hypothetical protein [bacterium]
MANYGKIQVGKIDLDTCGATLLHGLIPGDKVEVLRGGQATEADLANHDILCIEVGGAGRVAEGNFDHHGPGATPEMASATCQSWYFIPGSGEDAETYWGQKVSRLVEYIDRLDTKGAQALGPRQEGLFPTLSDLFAGMLLTTREPVEQLHLGVEMLHDVVLAGVNPYGRMPIEGVPEWTAYAKAKAENNRQVAEAVKRAEWAQTRTGLKLAWLETDFFGAPGALYGVGAQVVVAYSPHFGPAKTPKFTIAGNGIKVDAALAELNAREPGWGGPGTGTIIGSPREGSKMTLNEVVEIVRRLL